MKNDYSEEEIISTLKFVENKVHQYLQVINDTNLDHWNLDVDSKGEDCIYIQTSVYSCGEIDYNHYYISFETLLSTTEEQVKTIEAERKAEEERKKQAQIERQIQLDREREQRDYEQYLKLKKKYEK